MGAVKPPVAPEATRDALRGHAPLARALARLPPAARQAAAQAIAARVTAAVAAASAASPPPGKDQP